MRTNRTDTIERRKAGARKKFEIQNTSEIERKRQRETTKKINRYSNTKMRP